MACYCMVAGFPQRLETEREGREKEIESEEIESSSLHQSVAITL